MPVAASPPGSSASPSLARPGRTLHLAAALDSRGRHSAAYYVQLARLAEQGALDFVTLGGAPDACPDGAPLAEPPTGPPSARRNGAGPTGGGGGRGRARGTGLREGPAGPVGAAGVPGVVGVVADPDGFGTDPALDAFAVLARVAPDTDRIGIVPATNSLNGSPFDVGLAVATLDWVSNGRAGCTLAVPPAPADGSTADGTAATCSHRPRPAGRRAAGRPSTYWPAVEAATDAVARSWDQPPGSRDLPAPASSRPVLAIDATDPGAHATAARHADIALIRTARPDHAAGLRAELRRRATDLGRDPERLLVLADLRIDLRGGELGPEPGAEISLTLGAAGAIHFHGGPVDLADLIAEWHRTGAVDGFHVRPAEPRRDLERFVNGTTALLQHRGLFRSFHPGTTLREHLGLHRPDRRPTTAGDPTW